MSNLLLQKSNLFVSEWINNPKWWFSGSDIDLYLTNKYKDLLNIDENDNNIPFFNRILIYDQLSRHVYRNFNFDIHNYTLKAIDIVFDILSNSIDIIYTFDDTTWCFFWLPLRHSNNPDYIDLVLKFTWERLNTTNLHSIELKRFLKATYQRYPLNQINNIDLIKDIEIKNDLWDDIVDFNPGNLDKDCLDKLYKIRKEDYLFSHTFNLVKSKFNSLINLNTNINIYDNSKNNIDYNLSTIIISLSGGIDSMVTMYHLKSLYPDKKIIAVHINYNNRPDENVKEIMLLSNICSKLNIKLYVRTLHEITRKNCMTFDLRDTYETYTRNVRYSTYTAVWELEKNTNDNSYPFVVLGHNKDDCLENIFTNMSNKTKYDNLKGMTEISFIKFSIPIIFWRPLLDVSKINIRIFAHMYDIPYLHNSTPTWSQRGQIRNSIVPILHTWKSNSIDSIFEWANLTSDLYKIFDSYVNDFITKIDNNQIVIENYDNIPINVLLFWKTLLYKIFNTTFSYKCLTDLLKVLNKFLTNFNNIHLNTWTSFVLSKNYSIKFCKSKNNTIIIQFKQNNI